MENETKTNKEKNITDKSNFILLNEYITNAIFDIRYYTSNNFVGERICGYKKPYAYLTKEAAEALKNANHDLNKQGYTLKIFDAYRPQMAVDHFIRWAKDLEDIRMKKDFYPEVDKSELFKQGYIAENSSHSRGSTIDLTIIDINTLEEIDMGGTFDYFGEVSHSTYTDISKEQYNNRMILRNAMVSNGFMPIEEEWWHFTLENEPYPDTYFNFYIE